MRARPTTGKSRGLPLSPLPGATGGSSSTQSGAGRGRETPVVGASGKPYQFRCCLGCGVERTSDDGGPDGWCSPGCLKAWQDRVERSPAEPEVASMGELLELVHVRDGGRCGLCGEYVDLTTQSFGQPDSPTLDHIVATCMGGGDELTNLQPAHLGCNMRKGSRGLKRK